MNKELIEKIKEEKHLKYLAAKSDLATNISNMNFSLHEAFIITDEIQREYYNLCEEFDPDYDEEDNWDSVKFLEEQEEIFFNKLLEEPKPSMFDILSEMTNHRFEYDLINLDEIRKLVENSSVIDIWRRDCKSKIEGQINEQVNENRCFHESGEYGYRGVSKKDFY
jgi:hypothetical protein